MRRGHCVSDFSLAVPSSTRYVQDHWGNGKTQWRCTIPDETQSIDIFTALMTYTQDVIILISTYYVSSSSEKRAIASTIAVIRIREQWRSFTAVMPAIDAYLSLHSSSLF